MPIKFRISLQFMLFMTMIVGIFWSAIYQIYLQNGESNIRDTVELEFLKIKDALDLHSLLQTNTPQAKNTLDQIERANDMGLLIFVFDPLGNTLIAPSSIDTEIPRSQVWHFQLTIHLNRYHFYAGTHQNLTIVVGMSDYNFVRNSLDLRNTILLIWSLSSILSFAIGYIFSNGALQPIQKLISDVRKIDLDAKNAATLRSKQNGDEIGQLAEAFDGFIGKIREIFHREKEFTRDISHELRTPLMVIRSSLELIDNPKASDYQREKINMAYESTKKMEQLIENLLYLEREVNYEDLSPVSLEEFLSDTIDSFQPVAQRKKLTLDFVAKNPLNIRANMFLLDRIFGNLIKNALFYTETWGVTITIEDRSVHISDTGPGIPQDELKKIWMRFYRVDKSRNQEKGGFGLGLSIVKKIADTQKWKISVTSTVGVGTTFTITF